MEIPFTFLVLEGLPPLVLWGFYEIDAFDDLIA